MLPRLSIVTPSFNQGRFLDQTIQSVLGQRDQVHEYFVYDGGSTDDSVDVIRRHADRIDYWTSAKDKGQSDAIARGFARASGDFIAWLNSDDLYLPGALDRIRAALEAHPDWDVVGGDHVRIDAHSRILSVHRFAGESRAAALRGVFHPCQPTVFFRRSLYEKVGGLKQDLHMVMDTELFFRMLDAGAVWGHVHAPIAAFRLHESSKTMDRSDKYAPEYQFLDRTYPQYHAKSAWHYLGRSAARVMQFLSGRELAARRDAKRWRGRTIADVFGPPVLTEPHEPTDKSDSSTQRVR